MFNLYYKRKRKVEKDNPNITFIDDTGDCWEEYVVIHPKLKTYIEVKSKASVFENEMSDSDIKAWGEESPYKGSLANDLNPLRRVDFQAILQRWIDHSISSTINLPETITEKEVSDIYMHAWKSGCKGITIYREGSRQGVLTNFTEKRTDIKTQDAPKRPKELDAELHVTTVKGVKYAVIIGFLGDIPYEVFAFEDGKFENNFIEGKVVKVKKGQYKFISKEITIENLQLASEYREEIAFTILTSMLMRHGAKLEFIVKTLEKIPLEVNSFNKAIIRVLKKYIKDGTKAGNSLCPECGEILVFEGGCQTCHNCGWSKC